MDETVLVSKPVESCSWENDPDNAGRLLSNLLRSMHENPDPGLDVGIPWLTERLKIHAGELVVLAAEYGMGKSALAMQMARHIAGTGRRTAYYVLDNSREENLRRLLTAGLQIDLHRVLGCDLSADELESGLQFAAAQQKRPLRIVSATGWSVKQIDADIAAHRVEVAFVDCIQSAIVPGVTDQTTAVTLVSRDLAIMANRRKCVVIGLSQIVLPAPYSGWQRPGLTTLRDSRKIAGDARAVIMMYAPGGDTCSPQRILEIVKANNAKSNDAVVLQFDGSRMTYVQLQAEDKLPTRAPRPVHR